ncbi:MAG TPA: glucosamine-6-phosphate deaminase [Erysipelotrichaceae bacterium]|nr:glucosamine-6-phosphate deaminase [Erysipelotrichaceae bacterium]
MKVVIVKDYDEMSKAAANIMIEAVRENPEINLGLATGGSPVGMYENLVKDHKENKTSYKDVKSFNLDEYLGLPQQHSQTYYTFMHQNLFDHIDIKEENIFIPSSDKDKAEENAQAYEKLITDHQIDLQLLGIGTNGHIGFNEPGASFDGKTDIVDLTSETIEANSRYFEGNKDLVPTQAISMGIGSIMRAKKIILIASGQNKAEAIKGLVEDKITEDLPASVLRNHPDVTLVLDKEAASLLSK